ncbi:steroidogenic acute regulatory protein, mitochondrial [Callorhinchus milii]|uniref:START domain-containing protein 1 n=2 Tax=Callorhinchus milii TaxID=7868 RepID=A0A4W3H150_CALMI|nr:steroidogenic acute regulatory protein, mitochondrial [Callorhinchus milii]|eukprot:gi/632972735/ref/XP_007902805.1/ PREDICTED: steroidogenic acute regulatory protein, mitochondrial-like [Callorhinchus milii]
MALELRNKATHPLKTMLPAMFKLCCGISHQHFRNMTGLKQTAVAALGHEMTRMKIKEELHSSTWGGLTQRNDSLAAIRVENQRPEINPALNTEELSYIKQGKETLQEALSILKQKDGWIAEIKEVNGDNVMSKVVPGSGKVFKLELVLDASMEQVYKELYEKLEEMNTWNPSIKQVKILQKIGKETIVTHEIMGETAGNIIGTRDFVSVRHCWREGSFCYLVGTATESKFMPPQKGCVRAEIRPSCIVLHPAETNNNKTQFTWLLSMDLKGWLPKSLINQALSQAQVDFAHHLRDQLTISSSSVLQ